VEILLPARIMAALDEQVPQPSAAAIVDGRVGAFDPGREAEMVLSVGQAPTVRAEAALRRWREVEIVA
jgi:hypothetical protein